VQAGDTLSSIAAKFSTTYEALAAINHIADPNLIYPGQTIQLDSTQQASQPAPAATAASTSQGVVGTVSPAAVHTQTAAQVAVQVALEQVGKPYVWAGAGPSDFDCSGLVMYAWEAAGVSLPHYSVAQFDDTARITEAELEPGDLVFYNNGSGPQPGHVTMYVGNGQVVAADYPGSDVRVEPLDHDGVPMAFGRVQ
jgi:cell wall-associated NlpC family hydrolase